MKYLASFIAFLPWVWLYILTRRSEHFDVRKHGRLLDGGLQ